MSEFLAEARVLIHPDTTGFRAALVAQLATATKGVTVPVSVVPGTVSTGAITTLTRESDRATRSTQQLAGASKEKAAADKLAAKEAAAHARQLGQVKTAALANVAGMAGLRGAVLTAGAAFIGATVAIQAFAKSVQAAAALETELNVFRVTAGATADEMKQVRTEAIALGRDLTLPTVSAGDAAQAITLLARAGLSVEDSLAGARGVLQLATAAQIDNATATELAASALNAFNLAGEDAVRVADLLANSANLSQGEITDMGIALRQSAGAAAQVGLSLEDTVTVLTALARTGLAGSDAGTTLRVALLRLVAPTKDAQKALARFNIDLRDAQGNLRVEAFFELEEALRAVSRAEADRARVAIFGQNAFRVSALLGRESVSSFNALAEAVTKQGAAAEIAGARTAGFAGQMEALSSNLETLGTNLGTLILPPLSLLVQTLNEFVGTASAATQGALDVASGIKDIARQAEDAIPFIDRLGDSLVATFLRRLDPTRGPRQLITGLVDQFKSDADDLDATASEVENDVRSLFSVFSEAGGIGSPTAVNEFVLALDELADGLAKGGPEAQRLSTRIRNLIKELQTPTSFKVDLDLDFDENEVETATGAVTDTVTQSFINAGGAIKEVGLGWMLDLAAGITSGKPTVEEAAAAVGVTVVQALSTEIAVAEAGGNDSQVLNLLRERERRQAAFLEKILARPQTQKTAALAEKAADNLAQTRREIQAILDKQASDAEAAKNDIITARNKADQAILDSIDSREGRLLNAQIVAEGTAGLKDDVATATALRKFYKQAIAEVAKTVKDAKLAAQIIAGLTTDMIRATQEMAKSKQEMRDAIKAERAEERDRIRESLSLDVQIAEASGNTAREVTARQAEIENLKKLRAMYRRGTNQYKQLTLEIVQKKKALAELTEEAEDEGNKAAEFFFEQLQAQQGFAANLLGNLITGPTAGLVGVPSTTSATRPERGVAAVSLAQEGKQAAGVSAGQANTTNDILLRILRQLRQLNGATDAPEAIVQKKSSNAIMDGPGLGGP